MTKKRKFPRPKSEQTEPQWRQLNKIIDPELGIGIVDLGLVYDFTFDKKSQTATVTISLTSPGCPLAPIIIRDIETTMLELNKDFKKVKIKIVWDPPWTAERMDPDLHSILMGI